MKITIFGIGHVGLVQGVVLAEVGHEVMCFDSNQYKVENIKNGIMPFYEVGLEFLMKKNYDIGRLSFTIDVEYAVNYGVVQLVAVNTPLTESGFVDVQQIFSVARVIAKYMSQYKLILVKSTVPVGTVDKVGDFICKQLKLRGNDLSFDVVSNPEFLTEGSAIFNCMYPERVILGVNDCNNNYVIDLLYELYGPFNFKKNVMIFMDTNSAELTKYAANCMLATKISFINEIANLAEIFGADIEKVRQGIASDSRIGNFFIAPGCGYGGSCFSKDIQSLIFHSVQFGYVPRLLKVVEQINDYQKYKLLVLIQNYFGLDLRDRVFALWGLSFKPGTDDVSFASSRVLIESLWKAGAKIKAYDPQAMNVMRAIYGERDDLCFFKTKESVLHNADALIICTEWDDFIQPDFNMIKSMLKNPVIFDGRNLYDPEYLCSCGFVYYGIGRGMSCIHL
ncbi:UDP-glucose dehydrogenase family protein [Blochmannia endosymbiont of Polyrhachis (Hedomyrma) turneri]|uniref:UDP-glucose dehydrogenase family protein n=1 Tax=Blochmannia endosymbiont of Polyrhachis (Hedomyrma) turneri TaxID=1505596 RepID=UPI00061A61D9|nr:UDP-glucose/GDP-mannose dehydrogenase family protein [Blochmannia endosymbiont of Polyrhachis (Hedomyrma) turneri]AKC59997.1 UDP-glucose 6-dehydrogenase [Blochmannia endosymbiont of Polyrhachis (Hedomyrma) turneri]